MYESCDLFQKTILKNSMSIFKCFWIFEIAFLELIIEKLPQNIFDNLILDTHV